MSTLPLPAEVRDWILRIEGLASGHGLDFHPVVFEMVTYEQMNMLAAYEGFPIRYRHWRWGMEYERLSKSYAYGLSKIYELVINTDPVYAYLLEGNALLEQKLVMAHVFAHADFFKNNAWFSHTNRKMLDQMANHAAKIARLAERHGPDRVEAFIDVCLSIDNLIDIHSPYIVRRGPAIDEDALPPEVKKLPARSYMDRYINPEEELARERQRLDERFDEQRRRLPPEPERDVMLFLLEHAPLERWQRQILSIIREEAYYFAPQRMTKIMNEGWASYWHSKMMTTEICDDSEIVDFAAVHSGSMAMSQTQLNPYKIGIELFRHIEDRWDKGRFGLEWERCDEMATRASWDRQLGLGRDKIFQVRKIYNDLMFIDEFMTPEFAAEQQLFAYGYDRKHDRWELDKLVTLWGRPVHLRTESNGEAVVWTHDGRRFEQSRAAD
ncbi:MAG: SpoVR family protein [Deltaproteobacteria bacterium]|nr:MAG: SpoVR family protein [Deltaproteobacteria bacterium]